MDDKEQKIKFKLILKEMEELNAAKRKEHGDAFTKEYGTRGLMEVLFIKGRQLKQTWVDMDKKELKKKLLYLANYAVLCIMELENGK